MAFQESLLLYRVDTFLSQRFSSRRRRFNERSKKELSALYRRLRTRRDRVEKSFHRIRRLRGIDEFESFETLQSSLIFFKATCHNQDLSIHLSKQFTVDSVFFRSV